MMMFTRIGNINLDPIHIPYRINQWLKRNHDQQQFFLYFSSYRRAGGYGHHRGNRYRLGNQL
jgi:hypothetical protein